MYAELIKIESVWTARECISMNILELKRSDWMRKNEIMGLPSGLQSLQMKYGNCLD